MTGLINSRKQQEQQAAMQQQAQAQAAAAQQAQAMAEQQTDDDGQTLAQGVSTADISDQEVLEYAKQNNPQVYEQLMRLSPEDQARALAIMRSGASNQ